MKGDDYTVYLVDDRTGCVFDVPVGRCAGGGGTETPVFRARGGGGEGCRKRCMTPKVGWSGEGTVGV